MLSEIKLIDYLISLKKLYPDIFNDRKISDVLSYTVKHELILIAAILYHHGYNFNEIIKTIQLLEHDFDQAILFNTIDRDNNKLAFNLCQN